MVVGNFGYYPCIRLGDWVKPRKTSIRIASLRTDIWTRDLLNTKQDVNHLAITCVSRPTRVNTHTHCIYRNTLFRKMFRRSLVDVNEIYIMFYGTYNILALLALVRKISKIVMCLLGLVSEIKRGKIITIDSTALRGPWPSSETSASWSIRLLLLQIPWQESFQGGVVSPTPNPRLSWRADVFCQDCLP
jgi:hypothetical protein